MAVQRALKLIYKYALVKKTAFHSSSIGSMVRIEADTAQIDGYSNIFADPGRIAIELREDDSSVVESPEFTGGSLANLKASMIKHTFVPQQTLFGSSLNSLGSSLGISRHPGESDASLRSRVKSIFGGPTGYSIGGKAKK